MPKRFCPKCRSSDCTCKRRRTFSDLRRGSARDRGYDSRWDRAAKAFLQKRENQICVCGCNQPSEAVDHIVPHRGDEFLLREVANWQPMTKNCNTRKSQTGEDDRNRAFYDHLIANDVSQKEALQRVKQCQKTN